ncbi:hypothetical protein BDV96DRAFT_382608 [Lophiotrema nucula]|uniref:F-box domain-containing protein n=1 Tax=Lophiotrema nucula TaxID=690887 RepID=A0A6A5ZHP0_9PLEO|nr:hypothetical protein BDV96DRAFT_382608 [Lophiotrema nucula]
MQAFSLFVPEADEYFSFELENNVPLADQYARWLEIRLARPVVEARESHTTKPTSHTLIAEADPTVSTLLALPTELQLYVLENLDDLSLAKTALTCRHLFDVACHVLPKHYLRRLAPWAGKRLLCMTENTSAKDELPQKFFEESTVSSIRTRIATKPCPCSVSGGPLGVTSDKRIAPLLEKTFNRIDDENIWLPNSYSTKQQDRSNRTLLRSLLSGSRVGVANTPFYPRDQQWILRNLTTKEYVRDDVIAARRGTGPFIVSDEYGFGQIVLSRTSWGRLERSNCFEKLDDRPDKQDLHRGVWAGHAFDIVTVGMHEAETKEEDDWIDVSEEVHAEMLEAIFGEGVC